MNLLQSINSPKDLKKLNQVQLKQLCQELREHIISCCAENPGHIGASLGAVELVVALHYVLDTPKDKLIWDVGHQAYAHKILTGRRDCFTENRKYKGISGFPKIEESEYDAFGVGHSSTSISAALGMSVAAKLNKTREQVVAIIGDGALSGGMAYEGLNNAGALKSDIIVIVNDNQISIDPNVGAMHHYLLRISTSHLYNRIKNRLWRVLGSCKLRAFIQKFMFSTKIAFFKNGSLFESLGFRYFGTIDGNDLSELIMTISNIKDIKGPKLLHVRTLKGKGFKPAEENQVVWHAPGKFDPISGKRAESNVPIPRYQDVFGETLIELAKINNKIIGITPAMPSGSSLNIMMEAIPERSFDVGIAEQHAVTFAAGLAASGMLPYCNVYSSFMQRAYDSIVHDVAVQNLKVILCLDRGGLVGEDGATHHGVFDLAYLRCIPNMTITAPSNELELRNLMYSVQFEEYSGPTSIRFPRGYGEGIEIGENFEYIPKGKAKLLREGKGVAILSIGTITNAVSKAIEKASKEGFDDIMHYDLRFLKPLDTEAINNAIKNCHTIITAEEGTIKGGLFSAISEYLSEQSIFREIKGIGIPDKFVEQGSVSELKKECGIDSDSIYEVIKNVLSSRKT